MGTTRGFRLGCYELLNLQSVKVWVARIELNPLGAGKGLTCVYEMATKVGVKVLLEIAPTMLIDCDHESS